MKSSNSVIFIALTCATLYSGASTRANEQTLKQYCLSRGVAVHCKNGDEGRRSNNESDSLANEPGILEVSSKYKYVGDFKNGLKHGYGTLSFTSGLWYQGEFESGMPHGKGTHKYQGITITGIIVRGNFNGLGSIVYADGAQYIGNLKNNLPDGEGALYNPKGDAGLGILSKEGQIIRYDPTFKDKYPLVRGKSAQNDAFSDAQRQYVNGASTVEVKKKTTQDNEITLAAGERAFMLASGPASGGNGERETSVHRILPATRTVYGVPGTRSMRMTYRVNCTSRQWSISEVVLFPDHTMNSPPLRSFDLSSQKVAYPPLESDPLAGEVFKVACATPLFALSNPPGDIGGKRPEASPSTSAVPRLVVPPKPASLGVGAPPMPTPAPGQAPSEPETQLVTESLPKPPSATDMAGSTQLPRPPAAEHRGPAIAMGRPFPDASWTLGTLAALAHYAYTDPYAQAARQQALPVLSALLERHSDNGPAPSPKDIIPLGILNTAIEKAEEEMRRFDADAQTKATFLAANGLVVDVPAGVQALLAEARNTPMLAGLRVEFYLQPNTNEHVIVFRGSAQVEDWLNNLWLGIDLGNVEAPYYQHAET